MSNDTRLRAPKGGCTVRMYRQGLGDCFLIAFGTMDGEQKYVLIDCGVLLGTKDSAKTMKKVVNNIRISTGAKLDAVVITHEHWDHISGFSESREEFEKINVDQLWLAWTENPGNPLARELRERKRSALNGFHQILVATESRSSVYLERIRTLRMFFGPSIGEKGRSSTEETLDWVKSRWKNHRYCCPGGAPMTLPGLPDIRFFVLGPPADVKYIRKSRPSKKIGQVYLDNAENGELGVCLKALNLHYEGAELTNIDSSDKWTPFNKAYHLDKGQQNWAAVDSHYNSEPWRNIEVDWQGIAGDLALRLDEHTNNTSLVLAIELGKNNKVLLFPGDAQVGNWLSWSDVKWTGEYETLTVADLLSRTALYKVSHHGSHNATLKNQGLELMTNPELAALISVDRITSANMHWRMPHEPLHERLVEKTLGRLILADSGLPVLGADEAVDEFLDSCQQKDLYVDLAIEPWVS